MTMFRPRAYERQHMCLQPTDAQPTVESHVLPGIQWFTKTTPAHKSPSGKNFRATKRWSLMSSALYTTPLPPPPSFSTMAVVRDGLADHGIDEC